jgi:hypothetical protein
MEASAKLVSIGNVGKGVCTIQLHSYRYHSHQAELPTVVVEGQHLEEVVGQHLTEEAAEATSTW